MSIAAPTDMVFDVIASPYLRKTPRAMQAKLQRVAFRLLRGPVPSLTETLEIHQTDDGTDLEPRRAWHSLWRLGSWWGRARRAIVGRALSAALSSIRTEAERRAGSRIAR